MKAMVFLLKLWYALALLVAALACWILVFFYYVWRAVTWFFDSNNYKPFK